MTSVGTTHQNPYEKLLQGPQEAEQEAYLGTGKVGSSIRLHYSSKMSMVHRELRQVKGSERKKAR